MSKYFHNIFAVERSSGTNRVIGFVNTRMSLARRGANLIDTARTLHDVDITYYIKPTCDIGQYFRTLNCCFLLSASVKIDKITGRSLARPFFRWFRKSCYYMVHDIFLARVFWSYVSTRMSYNLHTIYVLFCYSLSKIYKYKVRPWNVIRNLLK